MTLLLTISRLDGLQHCLIQCTSLKGFFIKPLWAKEKASDSRVSGPWISNWKEILKEELKKIGDEKAKNQNIVQKQIPQIKRMAALDPAGVHELNMAVVHFEKLNMKAIATQSEQNLAKLEKARTTAKTHHQIKDEDREKILENIKNYRDAILKLREGAHQAAHQLNRIELLQLEKVRQYAAFEHEKELGQKLLKALSATPDR